MSKRRVKIRLADFFSRYQVDFFEYFVLRLSPRAYAMYSWGLRGGCVIELSICEQLDRKVIGETTHIAAQRKIISQLYKILLEEPHLG